MVNGFFGCEARENTTHLRYAAGVGALEKPVADALLKSYEDALTELSYLIGSIDKKIKSRGKAKPMDLHEELDEYTIQPSNHLTI